MVNDYRFTHYCPQFENLKDKKSSVANEVHQDAPRAIDMHAYISKNSCRYKLLFMEAYSFKCAYCGTSTDIIPKEMYEIDHFIHEKSFPSKAQAGFVDNLVLACHTCNHNKRALSLPAEHQVLLHPDNEGIRGVFTRDENYYIITSDEYDKDPCVSSFYNQLGLGDETRRLDYLLMSMIGLQRNVTDDHDLYTALGQAIDKLRIKRNIT